MDDYDVVLSYIAMGGIPYYLSQFRPDLSVFQNIDALLFDKEGNLADEFDKLFKSQFTNPALLKDIVTHIGSKRSGMTRDELLKSLKQSSGGTFSDALKALEKSRFITAYTPFLEDETKYRLTDQFCYFYLHHVKKNFGNKSFWQNNHNSAAMNTWLGLAFEDVVFNHVDQVKQALGISGVISREASWNIQGDGDKKTGMQIDLIIDRDDRVVNLCEMKFSRSEFQISSEYARKIETRVEQILTLKKGVGAIQPVLITTYGLKQGASSKVFSKVLTMDDLFV